ncbi:MAG: hypothetical protein LBG87_08030 [Spirochaetaceae bacterium]|jgi:hypothetical protein|nr:hypothetical protein [Spirochaetaceae bacterium]
MLSIVVWGLAGGLSAQQQAVLLDEAISNAVWDLIDLLPMNVKIGVAELQAPSEDLSAYLAERVTALLNHAGITVIAIDAAAQARINAEIIRQLRSASESEAHSLANQLAADAIITGYIRDRGDGFYSLVFISMHVETAEQHTATPQKVKADASLSRLAGVPYRDPEAWKRKWLYLGAWLGYGLRFSWGVQASMQVIPLLAVTLEAGMTGFYYERLLRYDTVYDRNVYEDVFEAPFTAGLFPALTVRPFDFSLEAYAGPYFAFHDAIGFGILAGLDIGYKVGPGMLFADIRYSLWGIHSQRTLNFGLGYKLGFFSKSSSR